MCRVNHWDSGQKLRPSGNPVHSLGPDGIISLSASCRQPSLKGVHDNTPKTLHIRILAQ